MQPTATMIWNASSLRNIYRVKKKKMKIGPTSEDCQYIDNCTYNLALVSILGKISKNNYLFLTRMSRLRWKLKRQGSEVHTRKLVKRKTGWWKESLNVYSKTRSQRDQVNLSSTMPALLILVVESKILHDHCWIRIRIFKQFFPNVFTKQRGEMAEGNDTVWETTSQ